MIKSINSIKPIPTEPIPTEPIPVEMLNDSPKIYGPFLGGSDSNIQNKLNSLYDKIKWDADVTNNNNEFF